MTAAPVEFYDAAMVAPDSPAMLSLNDSPWRALYMEAARWIPANHDVVDLGCGTGRFMEALYRVEHYGQRVGLDWSRAALDEARRFAGHSTFDYCDLREWQPDPDRKGSTSYVCLEVLEHLDDDLGLIERVPVGHQLVFSVPNYESESHLRHFGSAGAVWHRYATLVGIRRWSLIEIDDRKSIHVMDGVRRKDAW